MEVTALFRKRAKGAAPERCERWFLEPGAPEDKRQVSLLSRKVRETVEQMGAPGLCMKRFYANLEVAGLPPLACGERLLVGGALLEITDARKRCFDECALNRAGAVCPLRDGCRFARVVRGGAVCLCDGVAVAKRDVYPHPQPGAHW